MRKEFEHMDKKRIEQIKIQFDNVIQVTGSEPIEIRLPQSHWL